MLDFYARHKNSIKNYLPSNHSDIGFFMLLTIRTYKYYIPPNGNFFAFKIRRKIFMLILAYFFNAGNLKSTQFFTLIFHDFFMNFFHFEKNSGFSISCTSHRRGDMYRNFTPSDPIFPLWARAPTARAVPVELCMFFITFSTVFLLILLGTWVRFA